MRFDIWRRYFQGNGSGKGNDKGNGKGSGKGKAKTKTRRLWGLSDTVAGTESANLKVSTFKILSLS